jgi:uridine kinase
MGILIGIGGISRAGKSKLAEYLKQHLLDAEVINQDNFIKNQSEIPIIKGRIDWEHPDSIDWPALENKISERLQNQSYTLLEGLFAFHNKKIESQMNLKIQLSLDKQRFLDLKKVDKRWGEEPDWFIEHIWQSHLKYGQVKNEANLLKIHNIDNADYKLIMQEIQNV